MLHLLNHWFKHCRCRTCMKLHMFHGVYDRLVMCFSTSYDSSNKKFELMLTGRAKAYSSFCPQAVTHCSTNRARRRVTSFRPKRITNYTTPPSLFVNSALCYAICYYCYVDVTRMPSTNTTQSGLSCRKKTRS